MRTLIVAADAFPRERLMAVAAGLEPVIDVLELATGLRADLLTYDSLRAPAAREASGVPDAYAFVRAPRPCLPPSPEPFRRSLRLLDRLAAEAFRLQAAYDVVLLLGEDLALPFAWRARRGCDAAVVSIGHYLHPLKKSLLLRRDRLGRAIDRWILYSPRQALFAEERLRFPPDLLDVIPFHADTTFYTPADPPGRRDGDLVVAAGLERRDYATLFRAVEGTGLRLELAAASPWSRFRSPLPPLPPGTTNRRRSRLELRDLYRAAGAVVVPLIETPFQAGISIVTEAGATGAPVIFSATSGIRHLSRDGEEALLVPPGDADALRRALVRLRDRPDVAVSLGAAARRKAVALMDTRHFVARVGVILSQAALRRPRRAFFLLPALFSVPAPVVGGGPS